MIRKILGLTAAMSILFLGVLTPQMYGAEKELYVMEVNVSSVPYWIDAREGMEAAAKWLDVEVRFGGPLGISVPEQTANMDTFVAQRVDGIILCPADPHGLDPAINRAVEAGIPVVTFGGDAPNSKRLTYVDTAQHEAGKIGGQFLVDNVISEMTGGKIKVGFSIGFAGASDQELRLGGYKDVIKEDSNIEVVSVVEDKFDYSLGLEAVKSMLVAHPDIDVIVGTNATSGTVIVGALREAGYKKGEVKVIAFDRNIDVLNLVKEGWITATLVQNTYLQGFMSLLTLYLYNHGYLNSEKIDWAKADLDPTPEYIDTGVMIVTRGEVDALLPSD